MSKSFHRVDGEGRAANKTWLPPWLRSILHFLKNKLFQLRIRCFQTFLSLVHLWNTLFWTAHLYISSLPSHSHHLSLDLALISVPQLTLVLCAVNCTIVYININENSTFPCIIIILMIIIPERNLLCYKLAVCFKTRTKLAYL